jgi:hypothetical protein
MSQHGYMAYLPVAQFGSGMTSATEIRAKWPEMTPAQKGNLIKTIYPGAAGNASAINKLIEIFDSVLEIKETVETVETISMFDNESQQSLVTDLSRHLSHLVSCIKDKNFADAQQLVSNEIKTLVDRLAEKQPIEVADSVTAVGSDYIEEKSISL